MSAYLGTLGRLIPIYSNPSMAVSGIPARTFQTTLEGRVKVQVKTVGRRAWALSAAFASSSDLASLAAFANGDWGNGPFVWVSPTAPAINLLMPDVSTCGPAAKFNTAMSLAGPLLLSDGTWAARSLANSAPASTMYFGPATVPVIPGGVVTASAHLVGAGSKCGVQFYTSAGASISLATSTLSGVDGAATRLSVTANVPSNAASCVVYAATATAGARPALTWTDHANEWGPGEGCDKAIVELMDRNALAGSTNIAARRDSDLSFTIREVG